MAALLLVSAASCSSSSRNDPTPWRAVDEAERISDPEAEQSLERHLWIRSNSPIIPGTLQIFEMETVFPEPVHRVLPDYGLYANPIP